MSLLTVSLSWLLVGYCVLTLVDLTASTTHVLQLTQTPRFYAVMTTKRVGIHCFASEQHISSNFTWYKASEFDKEKSLVIPEDRIRVRNINHHTSTLILTDLQIEDKGVYFCEISGVYGPGTEVQVQRPLNLAKVLYRNQMKDGLMILQGLLLALIIAAFGFHKKTLSEKEDFIYEEPEMDHIYEGLAIETCEAGDLYEEICVYAQPEGAEAPWE